VCLETLLKVGGNTYITLIGDRKALEQIDILHQIFHCSKGMARHPKLRRSNMEIVPLR